MPNETPTDLTEDRVDQLAFTGMRIHELALQKWLNDTFLVSNGYPVPVVFATPRDAFSEFTKLWAKDKNPFTYLLTLKDDKGDPVYQPYPSQPRYPLIAVKRLNWRYRAEQSYGYGVNRRLYYPSVNDNVKLNDLAYAARSYLPSAWDYRFQIDHFCLNQKTQAVFVNRVQRALALGGGIPQAYIIARYPEPHKAQYLRMILEGGDIQSVQEDADQDNVQLCHTSFTLTIEGFSVDYEIKAIPTMWYVGLSNERTTVPPDLLNKFLDFNSSSTAIEDVRGGQVNPVIESKFTSPGGWDIQLGNSFTENIQISRSVAWSKKITFTQSGKTSPVDLTGASATMQIRDASGDVLIELNSANYTITLGGKTGTILLSLNSLDVSTLRPGKFVTKLVVTLSSGVTADVLDASVIVT